jgi:steroid 5-alpha reductase family enzyme
MRGILAITYLPVSKFAQNDTTNNETAGLSLIGILSPESNTSVDDQEQFQLSPLHRWVRHPWYFFALVIIWTRDMNLMTLYFIIGSRLEERKLERYHGEVYRRYQRQVPGLVPLPWKHLRDSDVKTLTGDRE